MQIIFLRSLLLLLFLPVLGYSQVQLTGPDCVVAGTVYQYNIAGPWDSSSTMHVCITGGALVGQSDTCTSNQPPVPFIQVIWNIGSSGTINLQSTAGNTQFQVTITTPLSGGNVVDSSQSDTIPYNSIPSLVIGCTPAAGGACSPVYVYKWQLSIDKVQWDDIEGATGGSYTPAQALQKTSYYRRKVTDTASGTIAYSNAACIVVLQSN